MDLLLTPLLNRVLRKFIRSSSEGAGSELRVSLSTRGILTLHNLELCLDSVLEGVGLLSVTRAFARKLQVTVPWTGLTSQPIQVVLDTVELVLGPGDLSASHSLPGPPQQGHPDADSQGSGGGGGGGPSWLGGTLQAFALRAGLNLSIKLNNVVVKYVEPGLYAASLTFSTLHLCTCADSWREALQNPEAWLKKECIVKGLSVCLDQCAGARGAVSFKPVLRAPSIKATVQLPVFAFLEGAPLLGDAFKTSVSVEVEPVELAVNNWQLRWAGLLAALLKEAAAAKAAAQAAAAAEEAWPGVAVAGTAAGQEQGSVPIPGGSQAGPTVPAAPLEVPDAAVFGSSPPDRSGLLSPYKAGSRKPATKALGVFGRVWDYVVDEAQYLEGIEEPRSPTAAAADRASVGSVTGQVELGGEDSSEVAAALPPMHAELDFVVKGLAVHLAVVESCPEEEKSLAGQRDQEQQQQRGATAGTPELLPSPHQQPAFRQATTRGEQEQRFMEALQAQLSMHNAQRAAVPSRPAAEVHQLAALSVQHAAVNVSSVDASFTSIEVCLESCSLRRNVAAASLQPSLFASTHPPAPLPLHPVLLASGEHAGSVGGGAHTRTASGSLPGWEALSSGSGAGVVHYHKASWDEMLGLHPLSPEALAGMGAAASPAELPSARAVHVRWQNPIAAAIVGSMGAEAVAAAAAQQPQRCAVHVGQVFACWAPGFATSVMLLVQQVLAAVGDGGGEQQFGMQQPSVGNESLGAAVAATSAPPPLQQHGERQLEQAQASGSAAAAEGAAVAAASGGPLDKEDGGSSSAPVAVLSGLALEAHVGALQLGLLAGQAEDTTGAVLSLVQIECRSGPLNWGASWNRSLRECLLAPSSGFQGLGLRASVGEVTLAVAQHWQPAKSRAGQLGTLPGCLLATNTPQLQAVVSHSQPGSAAGAGVPLAGGSSQAPATAVATAASKSGPAARGQVPENKAAGSAPAGPVLISAALSAISLRLTGQQLASVVAAVGGFTAELGSGFKRPASDSCSGGGSDRDEQEQQAEAGVAGGAAGGAQQEVAGADSAAEAVAGSAEEWIEGIALELGPLQAAFCQAGGLPSHFRLDGAEAAGPLLAPAAQLTLCCPSVGATLSACSQQTQQAAIRLLLVRPTLWCGPGLGLALPSAEVRLASPARHAPRPAAAAPASIGAAPPAVLAWHEQPVLLLVGSRYSSGPAAQPEAQPTIAAAGAEVVDQLEATSSGPSPPAAPAPAEATSVQVGSVSLAITPHDFEALVALLACTSSGPALPPQPSYSPPVPALAAASAAGEVGGEALGKVRAEGPPAPAGSGASLLSVSLDQVCVSVSMWEQLPGGPQQQQQQLQHAQRAQRRLAAWASGLHFSRATPEGPALGSMELSLGALSVVHSKQDPGRLLPAMCPVVSWPAASLGGSQHKKALEYSLAPTHPRHGSATPVRQLSAKAAPLLLALSPDLFATLAAVSNPLRAALQPPPGATADASGAGPPTPAVAAEPDPACPPAVPLRGMVSIQGLSIRASLSSAWENEAVASEGVQLPVVPAAAAATALPLFRAATTGPGTGAEGAAAWPGAGANAAELAFDEVAVMVHQSQAAEGRPWLGEEAGLATTLEVSLVQAQLTVHHPGPPGGSATAVLPPVDGRLQLLQQPPGGCLAVGLHAATLPLRISMPAIAAISTVVSELSSAVDALSQPAASSSGQVASPGTQEEVAGSGPQAAQPGEQPRFDDLRWGGFTVVAAEPDPGPLQVKAVTTAQKGGLKWALSPQRPQVYEHHIHWAYPQDRQVTLLLIESCSAALLGAEFQLACAVPAGEEGEEAEDREDFVEVPIRAVALNAPQALSSQPQPVPPSPYASQPPTSNPDTLAGGAAGSVPGSEAQARERHDVALLVLSPQPSRQWQLLWTSPAVAGPATHSAAVLQQLYINPSWWGGAGGAPRPSLHAGVCSHLGLPYHPVPPPLACPITVALQAEESILSLLITVPPVAPASLPPSPAAAEASLGVVQEALGGPQARQQQQCTWDELARLGLGRLKLAVHSWDENGGPLSVDAQALVSLSYLDSSTQTSTALLEPFQLDACYESQPPPPVAKTLLPALLPSRSASVDSSRSRSSHLEQAWEAVQEGEGGEEDGAREAAPRAGRRRRQLPPPPPLLLPPFFHAGLPAHDLACLAVRAPPAQPGKTISLQALHHPLVANVSELTVHELQRLVGSLSFAGDSGGSDGGSSSGSPPILICNKCGIDLWVAQQGTQQHALLPNGGELPYRWPVPPGLAAGAVRKLQVAAADTEKGAEGGSPADATWSQPFEAMALSACRLMLPLPSGITLTVSVCVICEGATWRVLLQPGARVCNHLGLALHCCVAAPALPGSASHLTQQLVLLPLSLRERQSALPHRPRAVTAPPLHVEPLVLEPGASAPFMLTHWQPPADQGGGRRGAAVDGIFPIAKLWLGAMEGWSSEANFQHLAEEVQVLHAVPGGQMGLPFLVAGLASLPKPGLPSLGAVLCHLLPLDPQTGQAVLSFWPPVILQNRLTQPVTLRLPSWDAGQQPVGQLPGGQRCLQLAPGACLPLPVRFAGGELVQLCLGQEGQQHPSPSCFTAPLRTPPMVGAGDGVASASKGTEGGILIPQPGDYTLIELPSVLGPALTAASSEQQRQPGSGGGSGGGASRGGLECVLLTEQQSDELPLLRLTLLPQAVIRNCLPVPITLQVLGCEPVSIPAHASVTLDWHQLPSRPREAQVSLQASSVHSADSAGGQPSHASLQQPPGVTLTSQYFPIDDSLDAHLVLRAPKGDRAGSGRALSVLVQGRQGQGTGVLECRAAAQVVLHKHAAEIETLSIIITPGCFVSNLSGLPLLLHREGAAVSTALTSNGLPGGSPAAAQQQQLEPGATLPLLNLWGADPCPAALEAGSVEDVNAAPLHRRKQSWGGADIMRSFSTGGSLLAQGYGALPAASSPSLPQQHQHQPSKPALRFAIATGKGAAAAEGPGGRAGSGVAPGKGSPPQQPQQEPGWSSGVDPFHAEGRQRLYLQDPATGSAVLVTYRMLHTGGRLHLVLFRDRQPPFTIHNRTASVLELGYFPPRELPDGGFDYTHPRYALRVAAGQRVECDFNPDKGKVGAGLAAGTENELLSPRRGSSSGGGSKEGQRSGWEDEEDEDAFLDCLLQEELRARGQARECPPAVIKFREPGAKEWEHPCVLLPGCHPTSCNTCVDVSRACATTHIVVRPTAKPSAAAELEGPASESGTPLMAGQEAWVGAGSREHPVAVAAAAGVAGPLGQGEREEEEEPLQPLRLSVHARQVQLCLWDDDRRRLLPPHLPALPAGPMLGAQLPMAHHPVPGHVVAVPAAPSKELFCLALDGLTLGISKRLLDAAAAAQAAAEAYLSGRQPLPLGRHSASGGARAGPGTGRAALAWQASQQTPLIEYQCQLLARGLHCDSFLPGSEYPVVLTTLAQEQHRTLGAAQQGGGGAQLLPLTLLVTVHYAPGPHHRVPSFRNTWIHQLLIHLPTLALAADDAILAFADHAKSVLAAPEPSQLLDAKSLTCGDVSCGHPYHEELLQRSLGDEAKGAAASRLYIETAEVDPIQALADVHLSTGTAGLPVAVDVHRAPVTLSRIAAHSALFRPHVLVRGLMAHGIAEALLNAPGMLGSLELLFNPTGLVQSVRQGVSDLVGLPMAALQARSPTQFLANVGRGSASLVIHLTGWTLSSISGFSSAFSRAVDSAVAIRQQRRAVPLPPNLGRGLVQGLTGLAEGVAAGLSAVVEAPIQGYSSGTGVLSGLGRGLLGAIGLPVSGALELVGAVSAGLASSAGIAHRPEPRRAGRDAPGAPMLLGPQQQQQQHSALEAHGAAGGDGPVSPHEAGAAVSLSASRLLEYASAALRGWQLERYVAHCTPLSAHLGVAKVPVEQGLPSGRAAEAEEGESWLLHAPVLLLLAAAAVGGGRSAGVLVVCGEGGLSVVAALPLGELELHERHSTYEAVLSCPAATLVGKPGGGASGGNGAGRAAALTVRVRMSRYEFLTFMPLLWRHLR